MTRDEILNMPAGRELDALIDLNLFGFEKPRESLPELSFLGDDGYWRLKKSGNKTRIKEYGSAMPSYSTNIVAAWEVVDKIYIHTLRRVVNDEPDRPALWQALVYADSSLSGIADTAPLAICRAALLFVLSNEPIPTQAISR